MFAFIKYGGAFAVAMVLLFGLRAIKLPEYYVGLVVGLTVSTYLRLCDVMREAA